jgi:hypothetical protein
VPPPSHLTSCSHIKSKLCYDISFETAVRKHDLYKLLTFDNPDLISIFNHLGRISKELVPAKCSIEIVVTNLFFTVNGCQLHAQPPSWRTIPCRLSAAAYSIYSQLPSVAGNCSPIRKTEDAPCCGDRDVEVVVEVGSLFTIDSQSASLSWCQAPIWDP